MNMNEMKKRIQSLELVVQQIQDMMKTQNTTPQKHKIGKIQLVFNIVLAGWKTHVRQTIGITVRKRTLQHQQIQVKNRMLRIVLSLWKMGAVHHPGKKH